MVLVLYNLLKPVNKNLVLLGNYWPKRTYCKLPPKELLKKGGQVFGFRRIVSNKMGSGAHAE